MADVMFGEQQLVHGEARVEKAQFSLQQILQEQFLAQPDRHRHPKRIETARGIGQIGLKQALELQEGLVVERDVIDAGKVQPALVQNIGDGMGGKARIVLAPGKALLLRGGHDPAIDQQCSGAVVIQRRDPQDRGHWSRTAHR